MKIKRGQIRRFEGSVVEVTGVDIIVQCKTGYNHLSQIGLFYFERHSELVTLKNIRAGEWVECIKDIAIGIKEQHVFIKGKKYQVQKREGRFFGITSHLNKTEHMFDGFEEYFKPCLPPVKKETSEHQDQPEANGYIKIMPERIEFGSISVYEKPLYTNQDIMHLMEEGRFIEGDKITNKDRLTVRVSKNIKGQLGFWCRQDYVVFKQGDLWEIEWAKRWKKLSQGEIKGVIKRVIEKLAVYGQGDPGDYDDIEVEYEGDRKRLVSHLYKMSSGFDSAVSLARLICYGTWYIKEKRG